MKIKNLVVLEAIRKTKSTVPLPIEGAWEPIKEEIKLLFQEGLLEIKSDGMVISTEGKKALLLFNDTRKELIEPFEGFKKFVVDGNTIDARIPIASFSVKNKLDNEVCSDYLQNLNAFLVWEDFFEWIQKTSKKDGLQWQSQLLEAFKLQVNYNIETDSWKRLGKNENSATITATKATMLPEELVQITI